MAYQVNSGPIFKQDVSIENKNGQKPAASAIQARTIDIALPNLKLDPEPNVGNLAPPKVVKALADDASVTLDCIPPGIPNPISSLSSKTVAEKRKPVPATMAQHGHGPTTPSLDPMLTTEEIIKDDKKKKRAWHLGCIKNKMEGRENDSDYLSLFFDDYDQFKTQVIKKCEVGEEHDLEQLFLALYNFFDNVTISKGRPGDFQLEGRLYQTRDRILQLLKMPPVKQKKLTVKQQMVQLRDKYPVYFSVYCPDFDTFCDEVSERYFVVTDEQRRVIIKDLNNWKMLTNLFVTTCMELGISAEKLSVGGKQQDFMEASEEYKDWMEATQRLWTS